MRLSLPLEKMTTAEKLEALELIWADLCSTPDAVPSPEWHASELEHRETRAREGGSKFTDWEQAKRDIRDAAR